VISSPFNASFLTSSLVGAATVDSGCGVFALSCVVDADGSLVDVPGVLHAANTMDTMKVRFSNFFIVPDFILNIPRLLRLRARFTLGC
jgi:hypothetical protein